MRPGLGAEKAKKASRASVMLRDGCDRRLAVCNGVCGVGGCRNGLVVRLVLPGRWDDRQRSPDS